MPAGGQPGKRVDGSTRGTPARAEKIGTEFGGGEGEGMEQRSVGAGKVRLTRRRWGAALAGSSLVGVSGAAIGCGPAAPEATGQPAAGPTIRVGASIQWAWD